MTTESIELTITATYDDIPDMEIVVTMEFPKDHGLTALRALVDIVPTEDFKNMAIASLYDLLDGDLVKTLLTLEEEDQDD